MDPNSAYALFLSLVADGDMETAADIGAGLLDWMENGGFPPDELRSAADDATAERDSIFPAAPESYGSGDTLEFRLFIRPAGDVELCFGDPSYDSDHRGFCGAGSVGAADSPAEILGSIVSAFSDCVDGLAQSF
jgi:hypothetical protein